DGKAFVLFDSDVQQITSIYPAVDGSIYFSAIASFASFGSTNRPLPEPTLQPPAPMTGTESPQVPGPEEPEGVVTVEVTTLPQPVQPAPQPRAQGVSQLYRLTSDGFVEIMFVSME